MYINLVNAFCREIADKSSTDGNTAYNYLRMIHNGTAYIRSLLTDNDQQLVQQMIPIARRMVKSVEGAYNSVCFDDPYIKQKYQWDDEKIKSFRVLYSDTKQQMSVLKTISNNYTYLGTSAPFKDLINKIKLND